MGLNDDVEDSIITPPDFNTEQVTAPAVDIVASNEPSEKEVSVADLFGKNVIEREVPNLNAEFIVQEQALENYKELSTLHITLKSNGAMAQEDAKEINSLIPGFIHDKNPLAYYTKTPTRTCLKPSLEALDNALDVQYGKLQSLVKTNAASLLTAVTVYQKVFEDEFTKAFIEAGEALQKLISGTGFGEYSFMNFPVQDNMLVRDLFYKQTIYARHEDGSDRINEIYTNQDIKQAIITIGNCLTNYSDRLNVGHYLNSNLPLVYVLHISEKCYAITANGLELMDPKEADSLRNNSCVYLETILKRFSGSIGVDILRNLKVGISGIASSVESTTAKVEAVTQLEEVSLKSKLEAISKISGEVQEAYLQITAIANLIEDIHTLLQQTTKIIEISYQLYQQKAKSV